MVKGNQILLGKRNKKLLEGGKWVFFDGYVERNENIIEAVKRETLEESGYVIKNLKLLTIRNNPHRLNEDRQNIAFVYVGQPQGEMGNSDWETDDQQWFDFSALPPKEEIAFDHYDNIQFYLTHRQEVLQSRQSNVN